MSLLNFAMWCPPVVHHCSSVSCAWCVKCQVWNLLTLVLRLLGLARGTKSLFGFDHHVSCKLLCQYFGTLNDMKLGLIGDTIAVAKGRGPGLCAWGISWRKRTGTMLDKLGTLYDSMCFLPSSTWMKSNIGPACWCVCISVDRCRVLGWFQRHTWVVHPHEMDERGWRVSVTVALWSDFGKHRCDDGHQLIHGTGWI